METLSGLIVKVEFIVAPTIEDKLCVGCGDGLILLQMSGDGPVGRVAYPLSTIFSIHVTGVPE